MDVALSVSPLRDTDGRIVGAASIIRDMRATKEAQRKLSESYQRLKFALESAALSLWDWDIAAGEVTYSEEFARMLGFGAGELPRDSHLCEHLVHGEDARRVARALGPASAAARVSVSSASSECGGATAAGAGCSSVASWWRAIATASRCA